MMAAGNDWQGPALPTHVAEALLCAWGSHRRAEVEAEVGLPGVCPSCADYDSPDWGNIPPPHVLVTPADIDRACWAMIVLRSRLARVHRDALDHYRDGRRLGYQRVREIREQFALVWTEWECVMGPNNAL